MNYFRLRTRVSFVIALLVLYPCAGFSAETTIVEEERISLSPANTDENKDDEAVEEEEVEPSIPVEQYAAIRGGFRTVTPVDNASAAAPYIRIKSGFMGGISAGRIDSNLKINAAATVINEDDYHAEVVVDGGGAYRFNLESQALWHNLLPETLTPQPSQSTSVRELNPPGEYGLRVSTHQADGKVRIGNNPFHLTLGYWELHREGNRQTRFSDYYFGPADPASSVRSLYSSVEQAIREGTFGLDGVLGPLGVAYTFKIRDFSDQSSPTRYLFSNSANGTLITSGNQAFAATPDNRVTTHTAKLYSNMSGGLQGTASYTIQQRENQGNRGDARPSSAPKDTLQSSSGDIRYTPFKELSFAIKYRHLQIDRESPETLAYQYAAIPTTGTIPGTVTTTPGLLLVRPSSDTRTDTLIASVTYQPRPSTQLRIEYGAELERRFALPDTEHLDNPTTIHDDQRTTHTGKITASWKPYNGTRINAIYSYADRDNPAYTASFSKQHTGQLFFTIASGRRWGGTASFLGRYETTDNVGVVNSPSTVASSLQLPRETVATSMNASVWFAPISRLTITTSYSFLNNDTNQSILFTSISPDSFAPSNYRSTAHVYGVDAVYSISEKVDLGVSLQQIQSASRFDVSETSFTDTDNQFYSTSRIGELTSRRSTETYVVSRLDWHLSQRYGFSVEYDFRRYSSGSDSYNGSLHTVMALFSGHWW